MHNKSTTILIIISLIVSLASLGAVIMVYKAMPSQSSEAIVSDSKKLAGELADNNLPEAAIAEYIRILDNGILTKSERGSINYLIGKLYFEDIGDYQKAAAYYIRARSLDENGSYVTEAGKSLITCLERMGRKLDARRELDAQTALVPDTTTGKLVAIVGGEKLTTSDYNEAFESLPDAMRKQYTSKEGKKEFLNQLVGRELVYHAALREGFDREAEVQKALKSAEKDLLVQYYSREKIAPTIRPDTADLNLFFQAHKADYGDKELSEVRQQVSQDYMNYVSQKAVKEYIDGLLKAEHVQTFEENLK